MLSKFLQVVGVLSKPQLNEIAGSVTSIDQVFQSNFLIAARILNPHLNSCHEFQFDAIVPYGIENCTTTDARWAFTCLCMETILKICDLVDTSDTSDISAQLISVKSEQDISKCLQLIVATGFLPYLHPSVGIPIQKRSQFYQLLNSHPSQLNDEQKYSRLTTTLKVICQIEQSRRFGPQLIVKHLTDILAVFLQICHAPLRKPTTDLEIQLWTRLQNERKQFIPLFNDIISRAYPPLLVQSLLLLQGPSPSHAKIIRDACQPAPLWLIRICARLLSQQLVKPNGIITIIQGVTDIEELSSEMWQRCDSLAYIISTPPSSDVVKQRQYYSTIGPQLLDLVRINSKECVHRRYIQLASACFRNIATRYYDVAEPFIFGPLFEPLRSKNEDVLASTIEALHNIFVSWSDPSDFLKLLLPYRISLIQLYRKWFKGILHAKTLLEELLCRLLVHCDNIDRVGALRTLLEVAETSEQDLMDDDDCTVQSFVSLLQSIKDAALTYSLFVSLLEDLPKLTEKQSDSKLLSPDLGLIKRGLLTLQLIAVLAEDATLQEYLQQNPQKAVDFALMFLNRSVAQLDSCSVDRQLEKEILAIVFAVIIVQIDNLVGRKESSIWSLFEPLVKPLELLAKKHPLEATRDGADELRIAIKTQGFVFESKRPSEQRNEFQQAWKELEDPLLPVQGHGLLTLSNLLRQKNAEALQHKENLLKVFMGTLEHEDSYIYLIGIQALTALADVYTEPVLKALIQQLEDIIAVGNSAPELIVEVDSEVPPSPGNRLQRPSEVRLKVGEALLKVVRLIGPLVPQYKDALLHAFLRGTKDEDPFVRVSALQNLGELSALLRYSLGSVIYELLNCVSNLVTRDPAVEVRRGAVSLITLLLRGLDTEALQVLEPIIKDLYRILKEIVILNNDDSVVTFHATQALEKLAEIVHNYLTVPTMKPRLITGLTI